MTEDNEKSPRKPCREQHDQDEDRKMRSDRKVRRVMRERQDWFIHKEMMDLEEL